MPRIIFCRLSPLFCVTYCVASFREAESLSSDNCYITLQPESLHGFVGLYKVLSNKAVMLMLS